MWDSFCFLVAERAGFEARSGYDIRRCHREGRSREAKWSDGETLTDGESLYNYLVIF